MTWTWTDRETSTALRVHPMCRRLLLVRHFRRPPDWPRPATGWPSRLSPPVLGAALQAPARFSGAAGLLARTGGETLAATGNSDGADLDARPRVACAWPAVRPRTQHGQARRVGPSARASDGGGRLQVEYSRPRSKRARVARIARWRGNV